MPATVQEKQWAREVPEGGLIRVHSPKNQGPASSFEYLLAYFGSKVIHRNLTKELAVAKPVEACDPLEKDVKGKIVLVRRGTCPFVQKAENVQNAGGVGVIVSSMSSHIFRMVTCLPKSS